MASLGKLTRAGMMDQIKELEDDEYTPREKKDKEKSKVKLEPKFGKDSKPSRKLEPKFKD